MSASQGDILDETSDECKNFFEKYSSVMNSWCLLTLRLNLLHYRLADMKVSPKERAFSSGGERFPDTEEATSSNL